MDNGFNVPYHSIMNASSNVKGIDLYYKHTQVKILQDKSFPNWYYRNPFTCTSSIFVFLQTIQHLLCTKLNWALMAHE